MPERSGDFSARLIPIDASAGAVLRQKVRKGSTGPALIEPVRTAVLVHSVGAHLWATRQTGRPRQGAPTRLGGAETQTYSCTGNEHRRFKYVHPDASRNGTCTQEEVASMRTWSRVSVLFEEGGRVRIHLPQPGFGQLPDDVIMSSERRDGFPMITLERAGAVVETFFDRESAMVQQNETDGAPADLLLLGRHVLLRLTGLLVQAADGAIEAGTDVLFHRLASGHPPLPLDQALGVLRAEVGRIVRPVGIAALFLVEDAFAGDSDVAPVLAYVTEGRVPISFGGYLEAARIGAITGQEFRWEPRYSGKQDRYPGARLVWRRG
jgi:hypothetical protein